MKPPIRPEVLRLHAEGIANIDIARRVGYSRERVRQVLKAEGLASNCRIMPADEEIVALHGDGLTNADIAAELGISISTVKATRQRLGISARIGNVPILSPAEVERVLDLARQGWQQSDIAAEFGVAQNTISRICLKHGIRRHAVKVRS